MRVLVTGSTGFVGRHLLAHLERRSDIVPVAGVRYRSQAAGYYEPKVLGSIGSDPTPSLVGIDTVVHCAARVHIMKDDANDPLAEFRRQNVAGSVSLAERAANDGVKRFIFLSSVKVNGESTKPDRPFTYTDAPAPVDPYGISKSEAELALRAVADRTRLELVIIRPVLVYGPGVKGNFISLLRLLDKRVPLPMADVGNRRSLVSVNNLCDLIVTTVAHEQAPGKLFFASDAQSLSTTQLLETLSFHLDRRPRLFHLPPTLLGMCAKLAGRKNQYDRLFGSLEVSLESSCTELNWAPIESTSDGLKYTADWYKELKL